MTVKPHITGRPGAYVCRSKVGEELERSGYGATPAKAWAEWHYRPVMEATVLRYVAFEEWVEPAPGLRRILRRPYGSDGK